MDLSATLLFEVPKVFRTKQKRRPLRGTDCNSL